MAHRMFTDASGREWLVWDVIPRKVELRDEADPLEIEVPLDPDRRTTPRSTAHLPAAYAGGWLCFESGSERRRLGPIPEGWDRLSEAGLRALVARADPVSSREGRLDTAKLRAMSRPADEHRI